MADISEQGLEKIEENKKMLEQGKNVKKIDYKRVELIQNSNISVYMVWLDNNEELSDVEKEGKKKEILEIYNKKLQLIATADEQGNLEYNEEYLKQLEEKFKEVDKNYTIDNKIKVNNVLELPEEKEDEEERMLEEGKEEDKDEKIEEEKTKEVIQCSTLEEGKNEKQLSKIEEDLGIEGISYAMVVKDPRFRDDLLQSNTNYLDIVIAYNKKDDQYFCVGRTTKGFEMIKDFKPSYRPLASNKNTDEYNKDGERIDTEVPEYVLRRSDMKDGALTIDTDSNMIRLGYVKTVDKTNERNEFETSNHKSEDREDIHDRTENFEINWEEEAAKAKVSVDEFKRIYEESDGTNCKEKLESTHEEIEEQCTGISHGRERE